MYCLYGGFLVGLMMTWFSEKKLISTRCIRGFMPNLHKIFWMVSKACVSKAQKCTAFLDMIFNLKYFYWILLECQFCFGISRWFYTLKRRHDSIQVFFSCRCQNFTSPDVAVQEKNIKRSYWKQPTKNRYMTYLIATKNMQAKFRFMLST